MPNTFAELKEPVTRTYTENGQKRETTFWPKGATLADAGFKLSERPASMKEVFRMPIKQTPDQTIRRIMAERSIDYDAAIQTPEGKEAYRQYREAQHAKQAAPTQTRSSAQTGDRFGEARHFEPGVASTLKKFEESLEDDARDRCSARNIVANRTNIAIMSNEILQEEPERYAEYRRVQLRTSH